MTCTTASKTATKQNFILFILFLQIVDSEEHLECSDFSESKIHEGIMCHECSGSCSGFRYKCIQCPDYDLCSNCQIHDNHEKHFFIRIAEPLTTDVV